MLVAQAGGIFAQLAVLADSNDRIHAQDAKIGELQRETEPILEAVRPLVEATRPLVEEARPLVRSARDLAGPLGRTADDLETAAAEAPQVVRAVRTLIGETLPVVETLREVLPATAPLVAELRALLPEIRSALPKATRFLDEAERRSLLRRADAAVSATLHIESLQARQLATTRRQLRVQLDTLAIQREALEHIRNIDRKTGGDLQPGD